MMTLTSKASAGPATAPKQGANASNDTNYHYSEMVANATICIQMISIIIQAGGGSNLCSLPPKGLPPQSIFYTREK
ncbi:hypothetical protein [Enterobacter asburiae]|uniref:hypothetical protein n=1 Tax=Enterobacter asburiae TaxID=61645 RepID=UPI0013D512F4|nr:hypothetical protein [Enterobacter asburiae]HCR0957017.1 hypothetical protein [Enterobacter asburiae]